MATKMSEVDFAKNLLVGLSSRPCTISPDHVEDPRKLPARSLFTLPKLPTTMAKPRDPSAPLSATVILKTLRPPQIINESLPETPLTTTIQSLKATVTEKTGIPSEKIRLMIKGKILGDAKTLSEIVDDGGEVTISVMVTGGYSPSTGGGSTAVPDAVSAASVAEKAEKAETAEDVVKMEVDSDIGGVVKVLESEAFWRDLEVFLRQQVGTEAAAREVTRIFKKAWGSR